MNTIHKKIAIVGLGKEGVSTANYLGGKNQITIIDEKRKEEIDQDFFKKIKINNLNFYFEGELPENTKFDYVVRSPGVRPDNPIIERLTKNGATLTSATKIFFDLCPCPIIGVTGTKGKGTTSTLIFEMLKAGGKAVHLAGNIGIPMLDVLPKLNPQSLVVLELSSFQLFDLKKSPHIAVVLMITSEHLDWHSDTKDYIGAKESIVKYQNKNDYAVINADFESSKSFAQKSLGNIYFISTQIKTNGVYISGRSIYSDIKGHDHICKISDMFLPGRHNLQNAAAATAVAKIFYVKNSQIAKILKAFKGLPNRLELVRVINGVKYYNDSFSTVPETTIAAIEAFTSPKILILGGSSKNSNFKDLAQKIHDDKSIKALISIGVEAKRIKDAIDKAGEYKGKIVEGARNMSQIVKAAKSLSSSGDIVLLSPACASFDMFKNYQERGEQFKKEVKKLTTG